MCVYVLARDVFVCRDKNQCCITAPGKGELQQAHTYTYTELPLLSWQVEQSNQPLENKAQDHRWEKVKGKKVVEARGRNREAEMELEREVKKEDDREGEDEKHNWELYVSCRK